MVVGSEKVEEIGLREQKDGRESACIERKLRQPGRPWCRKNRNRGVMGNLRCRY